MNKGGVQDAAAATTNPNGSALVGPSSHAHAMHKVDFATGGGLPVGVADAHLQDYRSNNLASVGAGGLATTSNGHFSHTSPSNLYAPGAILPAAPGEPQVETVVGTVDELRSIMTELSEGEPELSDHVRIVAGTPLRRHSLSHFVSFDLVVDFFVTDGLCCCLL